MAFLMLDFRSGSKVRWFVSDTLNIVITSRGLHRFLSSATLVLVSDMIPLVT